VPTNGTLKNGAVTLINGNSFTQADINSNSLKYSHDGSENFVDAFTFSVSDGAGGSIPATTFNINVTPQNDDPVFTSIPITVGDEGVLYTYNIVTTDSDLPADILTLTALTKPAWLNLVDNGDGTGTLSGTPPNGCLRNNSITLQINDGTANIQQNYTLIISLDIVVDAGGGGDELTIQAAINNSQDGDVISVIDGTYNENINFGNKDIEIIGNEADPSQVIIDGGGLGTCVIFENNNKSAVLSGFTITNGIGRLGLPTTFSIHAPGGAYYGGGIFCYNSNPILQNIFVLSNSVAYESNHGGSGGGIYIGNNSDVTIEGTVSTVKINNNTSHIYRGGGICVDNSTLTINDVDVQNNSGGNYGGGIAAFNSILNFNNLNIDNNTANGSNGRGGGIYSHASSRTFGIVNYSGNSATTVGSDDIYWVD